MKPKKFYEEYKELLRDGKPLPEGVTISIGSKGSIFFSDSITMVCNEKVSGGKPAKLPAS